MEILCRPDHLQWFPRLHPDRPCSLKDAALCMFFLLTVYINERISLQIITGCSSKFMSVLQNAVYDISIDTAQYEQLVVQTVHTHLFEHLT